MRLTVELVRLPAETAWRVQKKLVWELIINS